MPLTRSQTISLTTVTQLTSANMTNQLMVIYKSLA